MSLAPEHLLKLNGAPSSNFYYMIKTPSNIRKKVFFKLDDNDNKYKGDNKIKRVLRLLLSQFQLSQCIC